MIDLHCHILPGVDDGPATIEDTVRLARATADAGVTAVVATSHVSSRYPTSSATVRDGVAAVAAALRGAGIELEVHAGGEIALEMLAVLDDEELGALRLGDGPFLLLEAPLSPQAGDVAPLVHHAQERGFRVVLAHPERSPLLQRAPEQIAQLAASGVLMSVTASAFAGGFGGPARETASWMLRKGLVHNVASDMHDLRRRPPGLAGPVAEAGDLREALEPRLGWLCDAVPRAVVSGGRLPPMPHVAAPAPQRAAGRWRRLAARLGPAPRER